MLYPSHDNKLQIQHHVRKINALQHRLYLMRGFVGQPSFSFSILFWLSVEGETL